MSISRPGLLPLEIGMLPVSLLSAISNQKRFDKLPIEAGISPMKLFKLRDLRRQEKEGISKSISKHTCSVFNDFVRVGKSKYSMLTEK